MSTLSGFLEKIHFLENRNLDEIAAENQSDRNYFNRFYSKLAEEISNYLASFWQNFFSSPKNFQFQNRHSSSSATPIEFISRNNSSDFTFKKLPKFNRKFCNLRSFLASRLISINNRIRSSNFPPSSKVAPRIFAFFKFECEAIDLTNDSDNKHDALMKNSSKFGHSTRNRSISNGGIFSTEPPRRKFNLVNRGKISIQFARPSFNQRFVVINS